MSAGLLLGLAIATEVLGTVLLRVSDGFAKALPGSVAILAYVVSVILLARVLKELDIGLTYAIWAGAGTATVAVVGVAIWNEPMDAIKVASIVAVIAGVVGLNVSGAH